MSIENTNIVSIDKIITPNELKSKHQLDQSTRDNIIQWRSEIDNIIQGKDKRLLVIMGPCSIHDTEAAIDYANKILLLRKHNMIVFPEF